MQENKTYILSTRPLAAGLTASAAADGIVIDSLSFIRTEPVEDPSLASRIAALSRVQLTVVFTSMNAVTAVAAALAADSAPWQIFCIGAATRDLVAEHFGAGSIAGTAPSAAALASAVISAGPGEVFFFCGDQRRDELPRLLRDNGITVEEYIVYRTYQTPYKLEKDYAAIVFFSPSAVHSFFSLNTPNPKTIMFAIGETTAASIREYASNTVICGGSPEKDTLIRLAIDHFKK